MFRIASLQKDDTFKLIKSFLSSFHFAILFNFADFWDLDPSKQLFYADSSLSLLSPDSCPPISFNLKAVLLSLYLTCMAAALLAFSAVFRRLTL
jgi:hypothetical protein